MFANKILLSFLLSAGCVWSVSSFPVTVRGRVTDDHARGIASVPVTDGQTIVLSDAKGNYALSTDSRRDYVYYTLPSGYESPRKGVLPQFFAPLDSTKAVQWVDFRLVRAQTNQDRHVFVVWADPQVLLKEEFPQMKEVVADMRKTISQYTVPVHAISAGDNVFDRPHLIAGYKDAIALLDIPFYHVLGNHDMDYNERSNELSDKTYRAEFGPTHYAFNVGKIHYIVLKDVFYYGYTYQYIGYVTEQQLSWLEQDLKHVSKGSTVVVSMHMPTMYGDKHEPSSFTDLERSAVMNNKALYAILKDYNVHIMAGHSHIQWNTQVADNILEHTHGAASGAWWQGEVGLDGTPKGYTVYEVDGSNLTWYYKGLNLGRDDQLKVYIQGNQVIANVFNYDDKWKVEWYEGGKLMGPMEQYWGVDPLARSLYPEGGCKLHPWLFYGETHHLFRATVDRPEAEIKVVATDRFGRRYEKMADGWSLKWSDEFNYKGLPDDTKWCYDTAHNDTGWGNNEAQFYTDHKVKNAYVDNGTLKIVARMETCGGKQYTSARLCTRDRQSWRYGKIEIRAKLPTGRGTWPALWMLPSSSPYGDWPSGGEIDIMENVGYNADTVLATAHTKRFNHVIGTSTSGKLAVPTCYTDFHVYTLEWDPNEWRSYVDGKLYYTYGNRHQGFDSWPFDQPFYLIMNLAIGGGWGGSKGIDNSSFPKTLEIDYVRVYQRK